MNLFRRFLRSKKNKRLMLLLLLLGVAFATIATSLYINGETTISSNSSDLDVKFTKAINGENDISSTVISADGRSIVYETSELSHKDDESVLHYTVTNNSSLYDADVSVSCTTGAHNDLYSVTNSLDSVIEAKSTKDGTVTVKLLQDAEEEINEEFTCFLTSTAIERTTIAGSNESSSPNFEIGDYVEMVPTSDAYSVLATDTGNTGEGNQLIHPNELKLWRIINKNDDNTLDAVSEYTSSTYVEICDVTGYARYVYTLQEIAKQYANSDYTVGTRMMGYNGQTLILEDTSAFDGSINESSPEVMDTNELATTLPGEEYEGGVRGDTLFLRDAYLVRNVYGNLFANQVNTSTKKWYWLASRMYSSGPLEGYTSNVMVFGGAFVLDDYTEIGYEFDEVYGRAFSIYRDIWYDNCDENYIRPIITLKENLKISGGTGTKNDPYILTT